MYKLPDTVVNQKVGDELVILDLQSGKYFGLDEVGSRMVDLLGEHGEPVKVVEIMANEYDAPAQQIAVDLDELIQKLQENDLLVESQ